MGKPITQSLAEVKKSANHCRFYAENLDKFSQPKRVKTESLKSYVTLEPLGSIFLILPFNFPFWLAFKSGIPIIACGNSLVVRPADTTPMTGLAIEDLFREAGWDNYEYQNIFSDQTKTEHIISQMDGVSFTGSSKAGRVIAQLAGKHLKKNVMELGGMDPFIVTEHSDIHSAIELAFRSRISNAGQVCISAKRFIVHETLQQDFIEGLHQKLK